ncbi:MAG TPA: DUF1491 domain-containing protein [Rhodobacteraceae bacterium]|jgi:hypothetical protein|nr:DUF1491 family protein [Paracoccaceae bacterium]HBG97625.1 DUF1491 domain-containing protein [Paracoccaceae bacterium]
MARLTSDIRVAAYLARLRSWAIPAYLVARGDATAGAVMVKLNTLDGRAQGFARSFDPETGATVWVTVAEGPEAEVDAALARQRARDPDLWLIEVEDKAGRALLDGDAP